VKTNKRITQRERGSDLMNEYGESSGLHQTRLRLVTAVLSFMAFLAMTGSGIVYPIFPKYVDLFGGGPIELGYLAAIFSLMMIIFAPLSGRLADKLGKKQLLMISFVGFAVSNIIYAESTTLDFLYLSRALEGLASAPVFPIALSILADYVPSQKRAYYIGILNGASAIGFIIGPFFGGVLFELFGIRAPFYFSAILGVLTLPVGYFTLPSGRTYVGQNHNNLLENGLSSEQIVDSGDSQVLRVFEFSLMATVAFTLYFSFAFIEPGLAFFIYDDLNLLPSRFGLFVGGYFFTLSIGEPLGGKFCEKRGSRLAIFLGLLINTISGLQLIFVRSFIDLILMAALAGIGSAFANPAIGSEVTKSVPVQQRSTWLGIYSSMVNFAGFTGPLLGGVIYSRIGPRPTFFISFGFSAIVMILFLLLSRPSRIS